MLKQDLTSPLPCLPRQGEGIKSRCRSAFSPRLGPTIFKGHEKSEVNILNLRALRVLRGEAFFYLPNLSKVAT